MACAGDSLPQGRAPGSVVLIFLTLGTHDQPFERALDLVAPLCERDRVVIQHGHTPARPDLRAEWHEFLSAEEMHATMQDAQVVICHAGVGCIMTALAHDRRPVVVPRLCGHGEHVDDHQLQIARALAARGLVTMHSGDEPLAAALTRPQAAPARLERAGRLRDEIEQYVRAPAPRRRRGQRGQTSARRDSSASASSSSSSPLM